LKTVFIEIKWQHNIFYVFTKMRLLRLFFIHDSNKMDKLKRIWNLVYVPTAFILGGMYMLMGEIGLGCLFILFATNETINKD
jgi:hypothetical protein